MKASELTKELNKNDKINKILRSMFAPAIAPILHRMLNIAQYKTLRKFGFTSQRAFNIVKQAAELRKDDNQFYRDEFPYKN